MPSGPGVVRETLPPQRRAVALCAALSSRHVAGGEIPEGASAARTVPVKNPGSGPHAGFLLRHLPPTFFSAPSVTSAGTQVTLCVCQVPQENSTGPFNRKCVTEGRKRKNNEDETSPGSVSHSHKPEWVNLAIERYMHRDGFTQQCGRP